MFWVRNEENSFLICTLIWRPALINLCILGNFTCVMVVLIWSQTVCKGYQQKLKVPASKERVKPQVYISKNFQRKIVNIFLPMIFSICFETVLLSTHNICFGWEIRKIFFCYALLTKVLVKHTASHFCYAPLIKCTIIQKRNMIFLIWDYQCKAHL